MIGLGPFDKNFTPIGKVKCIALEAFANVVKEFKQTQEGPRGRVLKSKKIARICSVKFFGNNYIARTF